jgi:outer membrane lipoprotein SlyB
MSGFLCAKAVTRWGVLAISALLMSACATDGQRTRTEGALAGAAAGAAVGQIAGGDSESTAAGALVGALVGGLFGDQVARKKAEYVKREDELKASADRAQQLAQSLQVQNAQTAGEIEALERSLKKIYAQKASAEARRKSILTQKRRATTLLAQVDQQLSGVRTELAAQAALLETEKVRAAQARETTPLEGVKLVNASVVDLEIQGRALARAKQQLLLIDRRRAY